MTVRVHLQSETGSWSEEIGTFTCEEYYEVCITALETWAKKNGHIITESVEEKDDKPKIEKNVPIPKKQNKYFWLRDMEVMDSVLLTSNEKRRVYDYIHKIKNFNSILYNSYFDDKEFTFRPEGDGFRMWRSK